MRSLQSYADTVSARKRPRNSCSSCVLLAPQTSPKSRIVWSLTAHRRRAPNSRPRADRENLAFGQRNPVNQVSSLNSILEIANLASPISNLAHSRRRKLTAFLELESAIRVGGELSRKATACEFKYL